MPAERAKISIFDRGFLYGDGIFELLRFYNTKLFLFQEHVERLFAGAAALQIHFPLSREKLAKVSHEIIKRNQMKDGALRITLSRGVGVRGYSPKGANDPTVALSAP